MLATSLETAFDSSSRKKGLLGRDSMAPDSAIIIAPSGGIHTCFMRFPIDVLLVAKDGRAVQLRHSMRPWRMAMSWRAFAAIELPAGTLEMCRVSVGDRVVVVPAAESRARQVAPNRAVTKSGHCGATAIRR